MEKLTNNKYTPAEKKVLIVTFMSIYIFFTVLLFILANGFLDSLLIHLFISLFLSLIAFFLVGIFIIECMRAVPSQRKDTERLFINFLIWVMILFTILYCVPCAFLMISSFISEVIFGKLTMSQYQKEIQLLTFEKVNLFYLDVFDWIDRLFRRLTS